MSSNWSFQRTAFSGRGISTLERNQFIWRPYRHRSISKEHIAVKLNPPQFRQRSRRQMKKLRIGEFRELGFSVSMELHRLLTGDEQDAFLSELLDQLIEARGLVYGGGADMGFVSYPGRGSATEEDREAVSAWLSARAEVKTVTVGPLQDGWHDGPQYAL